MAAANDLDVRLPATLADPVSVGRDGLQVSSRLVGGGGVRTVAGDTATFRDALPGVDVEVQGLADGVKETAVLRTPAAGDAAAKGLVYDLDLSSGLRATLSAGVVQVQGKDGTTVAVLPAPVVSDAAGRESMTAATYTLGDDADGELRVAVDPAWLADAAYPVALDPSVTWTANNAGDSACQILGGAAQAGTALCGSTSTLQVGATAGGPGRALLRFRSVTDGAIPATAVVHRAWLQLDRQAATGGTGDVEAYAIGEDWLRPQVTWTNRTAGSAWATPGGTTDPVRTWAAQNQPATPGTTYLMASDTVQAWVRGERPNHGLLVRTKTEQGAAYTFGGVGSAVPPKMVVEWEHPLGLAGGQEFFDRDVTDRSSLRVNYATGALTLSARDLTITAPGVATEVTRTYNSARIGERGTVGDGWLLHPGDTRVEVLQDTVVFYDPSGREHVFARRNDTTWRPPAGLKADLTVAADGAATITYRSSGQQYRFRPDGALTQTRDNDGNTQTVAYSTATFPGRAGTQALPASVTDTVGRTVTDTVTSGRVSRVTDWTGRYASYTYTSGRMTSARDTGGGTTAYAYDTSGRLTRVTTPAGRQVRLTWTADGRVASVVNVTDPAAGTGPTTTFAYTDPARPLTEASTGTTVVTDPRGGITTYTWDTRGRVGKVTDQLGRNRSTGYRPSDDPTSLTNANSEVTTAGYDDDDRLTEVTAPTGATQTLTYGAGAGFQAGLPATFTDDRGNTTSFTYDSLGNPVGTLLPDGSSAATVRQGAGASCGPGGGAAFPGAVCETRDPLYSAAAPTAHRTTYRYTAKGELAAQTPPQPSAQQPRSYGYDPLSRATSITDGKAQTSGYTFDALNRLIRITYPDGSTSRYAYDADGNRTESRDVTAGGATTRLTTAAFDDLGRLTYTNAGDGGLSLTYDAASNVATYTDPGGTVTYGYDAAQQLVRLAEPGGSCGTATVANPPAASAKCTVFGYDQAGRRTTIRYPGGHMQTVTYDKSGRQTSTVGTAAGTKRLHQTYRYTAGNQDTSVLQATKDEITRDTTAYTYDTRGRLTRAETSAAGGYPLPSEVFCYDAANNRTATYDTDTAQCGVGTPTTSYTYDAANALTGLTSAPGSGGGTGAAAHDANGAVTALPARATLGQTAPALGVGWNDRNQAVAFTADGSTYGQLYAGPTHTGRYATQTGPTTTTGTATGPLGIWRTQTTTGTQQRYYTRTPDGQLLGLRTAAGANAPRYYTFTDRLGSTTHLFSASGAVANTYTYSAYGVTTSTETVPQPFRYISGYQDAPTGLYLLGLRYYDPHMGRFTQPDPTGQSGGYSYAAGDPLNRKDSSGASSETYTIESALSFVLGTLGLAFGGIPARIALGVADAAGSTLLDCLNIGPFDGCDDGIAYTAVKNAGIGVLSGLTFGALDEAARISGVADEGVDVVVALSEYLAGRVTSLV